MLEDSGLSHAAGGLVANEGQATVVDSGEASDVGAVPGSQRATAPTRTRQRPRSQEPAAQASTEQPAADGETEPGIASRHQDEQQPTATSVEPFGIPRIEIGLTWCGIDDLDCLNVRSTQGEPVDAISVGHYLGAMKLQSAELALDRAISRALNRASKDGTDIAEQNLLLTQYSQRGIISGELGRLFFLTDPRQEGQGSTVNRVLVIAGMGTPGSFGAPELTVLARELCWSLGQLGKRHLAAVLIGAGAGNLGAGEAVSAWIRGVKYAVTGLSEAAGQHVIRRLTFVEHDVHKLRDIQQAIVDLKNELEKRQRLIIDYESFTEDQLEQFEARERRRQFFKLAKELVQELEAQQLESKEGEQKAYYEWARNLKRQLAEELKVDDDIDGGQKAQDADSEPVPTHVTVALDRQTYRFGALTQSATIPEREITLDSSLVEEANKALAGETDVQRQVARGRFMEQYLLPDDLRGKFFTDAPLVMMLDKASAGIYWEMMAQSEATVSSRRLFSEDSAGSDDDGDDNQTFEEYARFFLGTSRGFTRQLRTTFAPPPEAPPPPRRQLRVLIVANPADDLPEAAQEGQDLYDLFTNFNRVYDQNRIEVVRLSGRHLASRLNVLRYLMLHSFDILHFAGHCVYNPDDPATSGWIFADGKILTAKELNRLDRIPKFVFSNACESGITAQEAMASSAGLAPTFAEQFFLRGVSNFVCTAWPVEEYAARLFALTLYSHLLSIQKAGDREDDYAATKQLPMYAAMREARIRVAREENGGRTWGAYQHYGNPYLRFFDPATMKPARATSQSDEPAGAG